MTSAPDDEDSVERALRQAREALNATGRAEAGKVLEQFPEGTPARMTRTLAHLLDDLVKVPGTKLRFGIDPLLSLIPGAGTTMAAVFGTVVLVDSVRLRAPVSVLARMVGNYVIDWLFGLIPLAGAVLDMLWRSNAKNLKLLNRTIADREQVRRASVTYWLSVVALALLVVAVILAVPIGLVLWLGFALAGS